jgi:hypothetical protein
MSIQSNFPAINPTLNLSFALTKALDPRISFSRASTATYYGTQTAKAEENLLLQSQTFETTWSVVGGGATVTANTTTAPDGTATADTLTEDSASNVHLCFQQPSLSGVVTLSVFAKLGSGTRFLTIGVSRDVTNCSSATFDLSLGTNTQAQANGTYSSPSATITAVAESFYRCTFTVTTDTLTTVRVGLNDTGTPTSANRAFGANYTGDGTSSLIIWGAQLEQRSAATAYTPTTTQPITNYIPLLETAASGVARFDHNPITGESLGLLIEEQRTNLLTYSEEFDNAAWAKQNVTVTANVVAAPDGTLTAELVADATSATLLNHRVHAAPAITAGVAHTASFFVRNIDATWVHIRDGTNGISCWFNLVTKTVGTNQFLSAQIIEVGNEWLRLSVAWTPAVASSSIGIGFAPSDGVNLYTTSTNTSIHTWGAQLETGAFPTSYIPTVASQVTRSADAASMTGANFFSWFNNAEGTLYSEASRPFAVPSGQFPRVMYISDGTDNNRIANNYQISNAAAFIVSVANATQASLNPSTTDNLRKLAGAYTVNDFATSVNGGTVATDTSGTIPVVNQATFGSSPTGGAVLNGHIRKLSYYPVRCTDAQLQALTS